MSMIRSVNQSCCIREYPRFGETGALFVIACVNSSRMLRHPYMPGATCDQITPPSGS